MPRILVIDDDEDVLDSLEATLHEAGHDVVGARSTAAAFEAKPASFDVLLIDLWLRSGGSGIALKKRLDDEGITVPAIVMSSDDDVGLHASRSGFCEYLHKPFSPDQLHAAVARAVADNPAISAPEQPAVTTAPEGEAPGAARGTRGEGE